MKENYCLKVSRVVGIRHKASNFIIYGELGYLISYFGNKAFSPKGNAPKGIKTLLKNVNNNYSKREASCYGYTVVSLESI